MVSSITDRQNRAVNPGYGVKTPVIVASTANLTLSGSTQVIDGVTMSTGRVLAWNQTLTHENGIYDVASSAWDRARDFDGSGDAVAGLLVPVLSGTAYGGKVGQLTSTGSTDAGGHVIDSTAETITFSMKSMFSNSTTTFQDTGFFIQASSDATKTFRFSATAISSTLTGIYIMPDSTGFTFVGSSLTQTLLGKTLDTLDGNVFKFKGMTLVASSSGVGTMTMPSTTDTVATIAETQTLTNKTINSSANTLQLNGNTITGAASVLDLISATAGAVLVRDATSWTFARPSSAGSILTSNGTSTAPSFQAPGAAAAGAMTVLAASSGSSAVALSVDWVNSTAYSHILINCINLKPSQLAKVRFRVRQSAADSTTDYYDIGSASSLEYIEGSISPSTNSTGAGFSGILSLFDTGSTVTQKTIHQIGVPIVESTSGIPTNAQTVGEFKGNTNAVTGFTAYPSVGVIAGKIIAVGVSGSS